MSFWISRAGSVIDHCHQQEDFILNIFSHMNAFSSLCVIDYFFSDKTLQKHETMETLETMEIRLWVMLPNEQQAPRSWNLFFPDLELVNAVFLLTVFQISSIFVQSLQIAKCSIAIRAAFVTNQTPASWRLRSEGWWRKWNQKCFYSSFLGCSVGRFGLFSWQLNVL